MKGALPGFYWYLLKKRGDMEMLLGRLKDPGAWNGTNGAPGVKRRCCLPICLL